MERRPLRNRQMQDWHQNRREAQDRDKDLAAAVAIEGRARDHASTALPLSANKPRGRLWMKRIISTRIAILPSTAPAKGSRSLLAMPSDSAPTSVPQRLPTPPNTTTRMQRRFQVIERPPIVKAPDMKLGAPTSRLVGPKIVRTACCRIRLMPQ